MTDRIEFTAEVDVSKYEPIGMHNIKKLPEWSCLSNEQKEAICVVGSVLPFRTNIYVIRKLIDWQKIPDDPIFQLTFPQRGMLPREEYESMRNLLNSRASQSEILTLAKQLRYKLNPHPSGQTTHNVPTLNGTKLRGLQHKYQETVLFFPSQAQTCHAYCSYCFRWAQFVNSSSDRFEARTNQDLLAYLRVNPKITDVLVTGGDPLVMKSNLLAQYIEPLTDPKYEHVHSIRIGTKAFSYWPNRFISDPDAEELLRLFERLVSKGKNLAIMAHFSHPRELESDLVQKALCRVRKTGAQIRMQAPVIRHVNDDPDTWAKMWSLGVKLGVIPYYMFVERDTGAQCYFEIPLWQAYTIFIAAYQQVSGLARTVRGPVMSALPGKVHILGIEDIGSEKVFILEFLQARCPEYVRKPFFALFDQNATWLNELIPASGADSFFFNQRKLASPS
jgi:L-lysine 2,3-aminomutase